LKLKYDEPLSSFAFNFHLRRYITGSRDAAVRRWNPAARVCERVLPGGAAAHPTHVTVLIAGPYTPSVFFAHAPRMRM